MKAPLIIFLIVLVVNGNDKVKQIVPQRQYIGSELIPLSLIIPFFETIGSFLEKKKELNKLGGLAEKLFTFGQKIFSGIGPFKNYLKSIFKGTEVLKRADKIYNTITNSTSYEETKQIYDKYKPFYDKYKNEFKRYNTIQRIINDRREWNIFERFKGIFEKFEIQYINSIKKLEIIIRGEEARKNIFIKRIY